MNKIVLLNVRDLATDEKIDPQTDYGIFLIAVPIYYFVRVNNS
jgi:hypothetical protein